MTRRVPLAIAAAAASMATAHGASVEGREPPAQLEASALRITPPITPSRNQGKSLFPVEQILESLRQSRGFSFIFDSRLVGGKMIPSVERSRAPESALEDELKSVSLRLHKVAPKTFAITRAPPDSVGASPLSSDGPGEAAPLLDTILVMGTASVGKASTGSKRIFEISSDDLAYLSVTSPAEAIYNLPQSLASFTPSNTALYGATAGISLADLRGLAPKRTMVLVNGRRRTLTTGGNGDIGGVDLNSIAEPFLERIEVQGLPGGARHGGAAVAGTINFVTKSALDGIEAGARLGVSERGDSEEISLYAIGGRNIEGLGNLTVGINVTRNEGLIGADREFSATPYGFGLNGFRSAAPGAQFLPGYGGSMITERGLFGGVILSDGSFVALPGRQSYIPNADGSISPSAGALDQLYNWAAHQSLILPSDRILGQLSFDADLSDRWRFFAEAHGGLAATDNLLAPLPSSRYRGVDPVAGDAAVIPLDNPTLPQSIRDLALASFGSSAAGVVFDHRFAELGPRRQQIDRRYLDVSTGVETGDEESLNLSLSYRFSHNRVASREFDRVDRNKLQIALDPARCATTAGCALVDFFSTPEISGPALDFIAIPEISRTLAIEEHEAVAAFSKALLFGDGFEGEAAAGIEVRRAIFTDRDQTPEGVAPIGYLGGADNEAAINTIDAYAEIETPLFQSGNFPGDVDGSLALRVSESSYFDTAINFEAGIDWRPVGGVAFFARRHIGERAPDLIELFTIGPTLETSFTDPCAPNSGRQTPIIEANCQSTGPLGVGAGFVQTAPLASVTYFGNPDLDPERIRSAVYGVTISPTELVSAIPGRMQITASWLDFEIDDAIIDFADVLFDCYSSPNFASPACAANPRTGAPAIERDPVTRQIVSFDGVLNNEGRLSWRGLDLELRYAVQPQRLPLVDSLWLSALHTYTDRVEWATGASSQERLEGLVGYPRHRTLLSAGADAGRWSLVAYASRRGRALTRRVDIAEAKIPPAFYLDLTARFDVTDQAYIQASVQNLTDKEPAITAFNEVWNFAPEFYDPVGRRYSLSVKLNF